MDVKKPGDIDFEKLSPNTIEKYNNTDFSIELAYDGKPLIIQTPFLKIIWGVTKYTSADKKFINYSLTFTVPKTKENEDLLWYLNKMEENLLEYVKTLPEVDISDYHFDNPVKHPTDPNKHAHFRIKVPSNLQRFNIELYDGKKKINKPTIAEGMEYLADGAVARAQILQKPIWFSDTPKGKKYGYSYQALSIQLRSHAFED